MSELVEKERSCRSGGRTKSNSRGSVILQLIYPGLIQVKVEGENIPNAVKI